MACDSLVVVPGSFSEVYGLKLTGEKGLRVKNAGDARWLRCHIANCFHPHAPLDSLPISCLGESVFGAVP